MIPVLLGGNSSTGGACVFCYSHSSYFAEIPARYLKDLYGNVATDKAGSPIESKEYQEYKLVWGKNSDNNLSTPKLVLPLNIHNGDIYENTAY